MSRVSILGVPVDALTREEAVLRLRAMLHLERRNHVMTPNSEMLVAAQKNPEFFRLLHRSDLNLPDSAGLLWAARRTGQYLPCRVTGVDTVTELCSVLTEDTPVFLLGAAPGVAEKAAEFLRTHNPQLHIAGTFSGSPKDEDSATIIEKINASGAHLLLVAYGAPAQDFWIDQHLRSLNTVRVAMGIGGTFDFLAGTAKRAPSAFRNLGLEWLWRLITEPWRVRRIFTAVIVFPYLVLTKKAPKE